MLRKIANLLAAVIGLLVMTGCEQLLPIGKRPQPLPTPATATQAVELRITVDGTGKISGGGNGSIHVKTPAATTPGAGSSGRCECGCGKPGCQCQAELPALRTQQPKPRPIVLMLSDFEAGQCGACDAAWRDWQRDGASWPFELQKVTGNRLGGTSPTFEWGHRDGVRRPWRPSNWSNAGELLQRFSASQQ